MQIAESEKEFSFQQSFGERLGRAASKAIPFGATFAGFSIGMLMSPEQNVGSHQVAGWFIAVTMLGVVGYTIWTASMNMYLEGPRLGVRDVLRTTGKSLLGTFVGGAVHVLVALGGVR